MLTLVDTSIWIGHLRSKDSRLVSLLETGTLLIHSSILGEIAAGSMRNRIKILSDLKQIPRAPEISSDEVLEFIEAKKLFGKGLSWVDLQLLASSRVMGCFLLTDDKRLKIVFENLA